MTDEEIALAMEDVEMKIARDISKRAIFLAVPATIVLWILMGPSAGFAVALGFALIVANLFVAAEITRVCARISPSAIMAGALGGFVVRLAIVFIAAILIKNFVSEDIINFTVWLLTVAIGHLVLLGIEARHVSFTLAHPGIAPPKNSTINDD